MGVFRDVVGLLTRRERYFAIAMVTLVGVMTVVELAGLGAIFWFFQVIVSEDALSKYPVLDWAYRSLGFSNYLDFQIAAGVAVVLFVSFRNILGATSLWLTLRFSNGLIASLSTRLLRGYLKRPYEWFLARNAGGLTRHVAEETPKLVNGLVLPAFRIITDGAVVAAIVLTLTIYDFKTAFVVGFAALLFGVVYLGIRRALGNLGTRRIERYDRRFRIANEALSGIKGVKTLGREAFFSRSYEVQAKELARLDTLAHFIKQSPRFFLEIVGFATLTSLALVVLTHGGGADEALGLLILYGAAGLRLLPAINKVLEGASSMKYNRSILGLLKTDLQFSRSEEAALEHRSFDANIELRGIHYRYPDAESDVLVGISINIQKNTSVGFVGPTGSGKTTTVDLIMGLLSPTQGEILIDGVALSDGAIRGWRERIGYVPQEIYLLDASIAENIALGEALGDVDMAKVRHAARLARIDSFIESSLPEQYSTVVGDRGVRLSGGQRQRLGIARALYRDPDVLVFDEATSSLDPATEDEIAREIQSIHGQKTIIVIAHRPSTVKRCDQVYKLVDGRVAASGKFETIYGHGETRAVKSDV